MPIMDKPKSTEKAPIAEQPARPAESAAERAPEVEKTPETALERSESSAPTNERNDQLPAVLSPTVGASGIAEAEVTRDPLLIDVERELEEGLWDVYRDLPPDARQQFKAEGERIAHVVRDGIAAGTLVARRLIELITAWLKMIPHVNKWFLRQEAKNKTDDLMRLSRERRN